MATSSSHKRPPFLFAVAGISCYYALVALSFNLWRLAVLVLREQPEHNSNFDFLPMMFGSWYAALTWYHDNILTITIIQMILALVGVAASIFLFYLKFWSKVILESLTWLSLLWLVIWSGFRAYFTVQILSLPTQAKTVFFMIIIHVIKFLVLTSPLIVLLYLLRSRRLEQEIYEIESNPWDYRDV